MILVRLKQVAVFSPCLLPTWLWFPWRLEDDLFHIISEPRSCWGPGVVTLTPRLSPSFCLTVLCLFPDRPQFDCWCTVTQPTLQRAAQASSWGRSAEQTTQGKSGFDFNENIKCFTTIHLLTCCVFFIDMWLDNCVCVCACSCFRSQTGGFLWHHD